MKEWLNSPTSHGALLVVIALFLAGLVFVVANLIQDLNDHLKEEHHKNKE